MLIDSKVTPLNSLANIDTIVFPSQLIEFVALKASIPALGLWVLLCSQKLTSQETKNNFCQKYQLSTAAFDKTMSKLESLNLAWQAQTVGVDDWHVANLPKNIAEQAESFLGQIESLFTTEQTNATQASANNVQPTQFHSSQTDSNQLSPNRLSPNQTNQTPSAHFIDFDSSTSNNYQMTNEPKESWDSLELPLDFFDIAATKIPKELVQQYWDSFIAANDNKGEVVPERKLLYKKWKAYIANVSVNLAVSDRRFSNNVERKAQSINLRDQKNIEAWQLMLEQRIPQELAYEAMMNNLTAVENDVWLGFIQQNIRFKNEVMNPTSLKYAFEEYCKTSGQKFLRKQSVPESQLDVQLNDTSWANNLDDVL